MKISIIHSTVFKVIALMFCISFMAVATMISSVIISDDAQSDAFAVNVAGSLRMQSYRMLSVVQEQALGGSAEQSSLEDEIVRFEKILSRETLVSPLTQQTTTALHDMQHALLDEWYLRVKPQLQSARTDVNALPVLRENISDFVAQIDALVMAYQQHAESNIRTIRLIQSVALFVTIVITAFAMLIVNRHIERPLSKLTHIAKRIGQGDYSETAEVEGQGELTVLANTMNAMSQSIQRAQGQLEEKVRNSTQALRQSNASLELLFQTSRTMNDLTPGDYQFDSTIQQLSQVTGIKDIDLCIMTPNGTHPFIHLMTQDKTVPQNCQRGECAGCINHTNVFATDAKELKYGLTAQNMNFGVLVVKLGDGETIDEWRHQLFESLAEQIATGLSMLQQQEQGRRIALMNERTVIARELHDSLAQALSYLKIQVTRLQKLQQKEGAEEQIEEVIDELRNGLSSAYRELRELLTTFRLKFDGNSLKSALEQTVQQLNGRSDAFEIDLNYGVEHVPFSPQEEIHVLQIAREAMQNAFYHSKGAHIWISLTEHNGSIELSVRDDGTGIPEDPNKLNHYGLAIMQERSRSLGGDLSIGRGAEGGTEVLFRFDSAYVQSGERIAS